MGGRKNVGCGEPEHFNSAAVPDAPQEIGRRVAVYA